MLAAEARALAFALRIALRVLPLPRIAALLARMPQSRDRISTADDCARAAARAASLSAHSTCLFTSLTAFGLLARRGYAARLIIGAVRDGGFDAHAWVTVAGVPLIAHAREYSPLWAHDVGAEAP